MNVYYIRAQLKLLGRALQVRFKPTGVIRKVKFVPTLILYALCTFNAHSFGQQRDIAGIVDDTVIEPSNAKQHALVIGINNYHSNKIRKLKGAVNDAKLLRDALRQSGVLLPNERVLLNAQATRNNFIKAWKDMLNKASATCSRRNR